MNNTYAIIYLLISTLLIAYLIYTNNKRKKSNLYKMNKLFERDLQAAILKTHLRAKQKEKEKYVRK